MIRLSVEEMVNTASQWELDEEIISYAEQIQRVLSVDGDVVEWRDAVEMAYNELVVPKIFQ